MMRIGHETIIQYNICVLKQLMKPEEKEEYLYYSYMQFLISFNFYNYFQFLQVYATSSIKIQLPMNNRYLMDITCTILRLILCSIFDVENPFIPLSTIKPVISFVSASLAQITTMSANVAFPIQRFFPFRTHPPSTLRAKSEKNDH